MVINGKKLLELAPIKDMLAEKVRRHGVSHGLAEVGYDLRLRQDVRFTTKRWFFGLLTKRVVVVDGVEKPGRFTLASAVDVFQIPINLMGIVHDKSTWARYGLSVFNTVLEPGWRGGLTLELVFHGEGELHLPAGCGIAQAVFHEVTEPAQYEGKYQDQSTEPVEPRRV
jgi:dCTP deaminase